MAEADMLDAAHKYLREKYPKEHRHMMRLWTLSWRISRPLTVVAVVVIVAIVVIVIVLLVVLGLIGFGIWGRKTATAKPIPQQS